MAAESIIGRFSSPSSELPSSTLLEFARNMGITYSGEMFSAESMAILAEKYYSPNLKSEHWSSDWDSSFLERLLGMLCKGGMALVPYDVDKNHEPCMSGGKKAHWTAIKGLVMPIFTSGQLEYVKSLCNSNLLIESSVSGIPFFILEPQIEKSDEIDISRLFDFNLPLAEHFLSIIIQQSKSKHQGLWKLSSLKDSNHNLQEFDSARIVASQAEGQPLNVPRTLDALKGKAVFISPA
jgi:hypothetical protein